MSAPVALALLAVDLLRTGPSLRRTEDDHRPRGSRHDALRARIELDPLDLGHDVVERRGQLLVHLLRIVALDEARRVPVALEQLPELVRRDAREEARIGDLVSVEMED